MLRGVRVVDSNVGWLIDHHFAYLCQTKAAKINLNYTNIVPFSMIESRLDETTV